MNNLKHWQDKIKEKRKQTDFRDFLMEIVSYRTLTFYKNSGHISIYPPENNRIGKIVSGKEFNENFGEDVTGKEYDFLLKHGLPIPEIHWMDRIKLNFSM